MKTMSQVFRWIVAALAFCSAGGAAADQMSPYTRYRYVLGAQAQGGVICAGDIFQCNPPPGTPQNGYEISYVPPLNTTYYVTSSGAQSFTKSVGATGISYFSVPVPDSGAGCCWSGLVVARSGSLASGSVDYGSFHGSLRSSVYSDTYSMNGYRNPSAANTSGYMEEGYTDFITVNSATLPAGTQVQLHMEAGLHSGIDGEQGPNGSPYVS